LRGIAGDSLGEVGGCEAVAVEVDGDGAVYQIVEDVRRNLNKLWRCLIAVHMICHTERRFAKHFFITLLYRNYQNSV
jgi:hypothetical protein